MACFLKKAEKIQQDFQKTKKKNIIGQVEHEGNSFV